MLEGKIIGDLLGHRWRRNRTATDGLGARRSLRLVALTFWPLMRVAAVLPRRNAALWLMALRRALSRGSGGHRRGDELARNVAALFVVPSRLVVGLGIVIETGEQPVFRQLESVFDDERRVGVVDQVLVRDAVVLQRVVDHAAEEGNVATGANLQEEIGL